jgi:serine/threonine-protein kinase
MPPSSADRGKEEQLAASTLAKLRAALKERFAIDHEVGRGGTAAVFLAREFKHDRLVAVKVLHPELTTSVGSEQFLKEIEITAGLQHPNILPLLDSGTADRLLYYVMPYVEGQSLHERLRGEGRLPVDEALRIGSEVAGALGHAHERWVAHLDVKPGNILLSNGHAMIADFGIARAICESCRGFGVASDLIVGTPEYMSPEQGAGLSDLDGRSDIYSLACVVFEMLTGEAPFAGKNPEAVIHQHLGASPPPVRNLRPQVSEAVDNVLLRAMDKDPEKRLASAQEFADVLRRASALQAVNPRALADSGKKPSAAGRLMATGAGALSLSLGVLALLGFGSPARQIEASQAGDVAPPEQVRETEAPAPDAPTLLPATVTVEPSLPVTGAKC